MGIYGRKLGSHLSEVQTLAAQVQSKVNEVAYQHWQESKSRAELAGRPCGLVAHVGQQLPAFSCQQSSILKYMPCQLGDWGNPLF